MSDASIPVNGFEAGADCALTDANDIATAPAAAKAKVLHIVLTSTLFESLIEYRIALVETQRTPFWLHGIFVNSRSHICSAANRFARAQHDIEGRRKNCV